MNIKILLAFFALFSFNIFAQDSNKVSIELRYPTPIDNNFIGDSYTGIFDIGARYHFTSMNNFNIGVSLHSGMLRKSSSNELPYSTNTYSIQPGAFLSYKSDKLGPFSFYSGLGFTSLIFKSKLDKKHNNGFLESEESNTQHGFHVNLGTRCSISNRLYIHAQYEFIKLSNSNDVLDIDYNSNINLLKIGFGYTLKTKS